MTDTYDLWMQLAAIRRADLSATDRELLRPAFAAFDGAHVLHLPPLVVKRVRDLYNRLPKRAA